MLGGRREKTRFRALGFIPKIASFLKSKKSGGNFLYLTLVGLDC